MSDAEAKAKPIRLLILDVDGVLTSGIIYYGPDGLQSKGFHTHDGVGMKLLQKAGVVIALLSAKSSPAVAARMKDLQMEQHVYLGHADKLPVYESLKKSLQIEDHEIAYMGDDLPDLPLLRRAGLAISVPQAPDIVKQQVDFITQTKGGDGAVREACEFILHAKGQFQSVIQSFLN